MGASPTGICVGGKIRRIFGLADPGGSDPAESDNKTKTGRRTVVVATVALTVLFAGAVGFALLGGLDDSNQPPPEAAASQDEMNETETEERKSGVSQRYATEFDDPAVSTSLSENGERVVVGLADGNISYYNGDETRTFPGIADVNASQVTIGGDGESTAVTWLEDKRFGVIDADGELTQRYKLPDLQAVDVTSDHSTIAATTHPETGPGYVGLIVDGEVKWESVFDHSRGNDVAVTDDGELTVVAGGGYQESAASANLAGRPAIYAFNADGELAWTMESELNVEHIAVNGDEDIVIAGVTDDGVGAFSTNGTLLWYNNDGVAAFELSEDGSRIVSETEHGVTVYNSEGDKLWTHNRSVKSIAVSDDGSRVVVADDHTVTVYNDSGDEIWSENYDSEVSHVAVSGDGSTWSISYHDRSNETGGVEVYHDNDA